MGRLFLQFLEIGFVHGFVPQSREVLVPSWHNFSCIRQFSGCAVCAAVDGNRALLRAQFLEPQTTTLLISVDVHLCSMRQNGSLHSTGAHYLDPQRYTFGEQNFVLRTIPGVPQLLRPVRELPSLVFPQERPGMIIRVEIDLSHRSNLAQCPPLSDSWLLSESLAASRISLLSQRRMETLPPPCSLVFWETVCAGSSCKFWMWFGGGGTRCCA